MEYRINREKLKTVSTKTNPLNILKKFVKLRKYIINDLYCKF